MDSILEYFNSHCEFSNARLYQLLTDKGYLVKLVIADHATTGRIYTFNINNGYYIDYQNRPGFTENVVGLICVRTAASLIDQIESIATPPLLNLLDSVPTPAPLLTQPDARQPTARHNAA